MMAKKKKGKHKAPPPKPPCRRDLGELGRAAHVEPLMPGGISWQAKDGFSRKAGLPGSPPTPEKLEEMTKQYQENLRNSPLWGEMVRKFGRAKAEEVLKECRVELRPTKTGIFSRVLGFFLR
jgi:hypothetical protein